MANVTLTSLYTNGTVGVYKKENIYDPDTNPSGSTVPAIGSLITEPGVSNYAYIVIAVDATTLKCTYEKVEYLVTNDDDSSVSLVDYGNNKFILSVDRRTSPYTLQPDPLLKIGLVGACTYTLTRYPDATNETVISEYYDTTGSKTGTSIPLAQDSVGSNTWIPTNCHTTAILAENEMVRMDIYGSTGQWVRSITLLARAASIQNTLTDLVPAITDINVLGNYVYGTNTFYLREGQSVESLMLHVQLTYADGVVEDVDVDHQKCVINGLESFVASYANQRTRFMVRYFLDRTETTDASSPYFGETVIAKEYTIVVLPNAILPAGKVSIIPQWNDTAQRWVPQYWYYTAERDEGINVTLQTTVTTGTFDTAYMSGTQEFVITVDLHAASPDLYPEETIHTQTLAVRLNKPTVTERYLIMDSKSATYQYGGDNATHRRLQLIYDGTAGKHYISSAIFTSASVLVADTYTLCNPPLDISTEAAYPVPTHFIFRDAQTGVMLNSDPIALEDYTTGFAISGVQSRLVDTTVLLEYLRKMDDVTMLTLYGMPVDVVRKDGTYLG